MTVEEAIREGERLVTTDPRSALVAIERGLAAEPHNAVLRSQRAQALWLLERHGAALPVLDGLLAEHPHLEGVMIMRVDALLAVLLNDQVIDQIHRALRVLPAGPTRSQLKGQLDLLTAPGTPPHVPPRAVAHHWIKLANQELHAHRYEEAEELYRRAVYADPEDASHAAALAACLTLVADSRPHALAESLVLFEDADRRRPDDPMILFNWAQGLKKARRGTEAMALVRRLRQLTPDDPYLDELERGVREVLPAVEAPARGEARPVFGCGQERLGPSMRSDGLLVQPTLHAYAAWDGAGAGLAGSQLQPLVDAMGAFLASAAGGSVTWPFGFDATLTYEANALQTAVRSAQGTGGQARYDVAAAIVAGDEVTVTFAGDARCLLVRGGDVYRLGADSEVHGYGLQADDALVLSTRSSVEGLVAAACSAGDPEQAARELAQAGGGRVVVIGKAPGASAGPDAPVPEPEGAAPHHAVAAHLRRRGTGEPADRTYERRSLESVGVDTLGIAELLLAFAKERGWGADELTDEMERAPMRIPPPEVGAVVDLLVKRLAILREQFGERERRVLLEKGVVGPGDEVRSLGRLVTVGFLLNYLHAVGLLDLGEGTR